ncbi:MAG: hypothetical protein JWP57_4373 [Spirosoma sp.]|nr:hypothetical protein [Spirosoma sp.]
MSQGQSLWARMHERLRLVMLRDGVIDEDDHLVMLAHLTELHALQARFLRERDKAERPNVISFTDARLARRGGGA